jgi:D-arabinose 1-dehydrogenase-like Zn-dependent alcohol dehydrogenase
MRALQITEYGQPLTLATLPTPAPAAAEVLVRVTACGLCHSDLHIHSGFFNLGGGQTQPIAASHSLPHTLGHEIEGVLEATGPDAILPAGIAIGSRVAVYPWIGCGACAVCAADQETLCLAPRQLGIHRAGGFATHVTVPDGRYVLACDGVEPGRAGLLMCSGLTAYGALAKTGIAGTTAPLLLLGAGGVGLSAIHVARMLGGAAPIVADTSATARAAALAAGAASAIDPAAPGALEAALAASGGGFSAAIDFVGATQTAGFAVQALAKGGTLVVVGMFGGTLTLPILLLPVRQLSILGSMTGSLAQARALLALAAQHGAPPLPLRATPLADGEAARAELAACGVVGRLMLVP